ncbi:MAG TPA: hypothetical protein PKA88_37965 [Polyangiaceae bacterium]|nr:hypothetical protein [Polyangiaceae bacterium]HMR77695.1 hypothetical protein [Polyangiaceae bacterium]
MTRPLLISVSRDRVEVGGVTTHALVAAGASKGRLSVLSVGETVEEFKARCRPLAEREGVAAPRVVVPGDNARWDALWKGEATSPDGDPASVLVIEPLRAETWSPVAADALLRFAIAQSPRVQGFGQLVRPSTSLEVSSDFCETEYAQVVDVVRDVLGFGVTLPKERPQEQFTLRRSLAPVALPLSWAAGLACVLIPVLNEPQQARHKSMALVAAGLAFGFYWLHKHLKRTIRFRSTRGSAP